MTPKRSRLTAALVVVFAVTVPGTAAADGVDWDAIAKCESGDNWSADTGNGDYGGLQISEATWRANGGIGTPAQASPAQQVQVAKRILATQGPDAWPHCMSASREVAPAGSLSDLLATLWDDAGGYRGPGEG